MPLRAPSAKQSFLALVALRAALGAGWVAPEKLAKTFGLGDVETEKTLPYLTRLFAIRDVALAALTAASKGDARKLALRIGIAVDTLDTAAAIIAAKNKQAPIVTSVLLTGTAASAAALGVLALPTAVVER